MNRLTVLDVGHGNCAVLEDSGGIFVVDTRRDRATLLRFLESRGCTYVDSVFISHADHDHVSGLVALLGCRRIAVGTVYINPEQVRNTKSWEWVLQALGAARQNNPATSIVTSLTTHLPGQLRVGESTLQVLWPDPVDVMRGLRQPGYSANTLSAVVRIVRDNVGEALLPGDMDALALSRILDAGQDLTARVLVFPHHGGASGSGRSDVADADFARVLCDAVKPDMVVFSIGRGQYGTPREAIVRGVRNSTRHAHIACTQLSENCVAAEPVLVPQHLSSVPAAGYRRTACCGGSIEFALPFQESDPTRSRHTEFVTGAFGKARALCHRF